MTEEANIFFKGVQRPSMYSFYFFLYWCASMTEEVNIFFKGVQRPSYWV